MQYRSQNSSLKLKFNVFNIFQFPNNNSYSRQNLLSSANSKSNEMEHSQAHITHNNLPLTIGNKFRNQINQNTPPDVLNVNQQRYYHDVFDNFSTNTNYNNLKIGGSVGNGSASASATAGAAVVAGAGVAASSTLSSSSSTANSMPTAGGAASTSGNSAQGTSIANSSTTVNANNESNLLNSIANNNSNANHENR